ncbi:hypothetical protein BN946_scf184876.g13 [Trametes cinnabarina]|uniref:DUF6534 domain-containing protein n=1 Tax=Pycnoporus cinnabarinus TaxID=5643 RepID=A0A060SP06_PYCCI|nr:hypothetical protein BN946_scf184876.g13 [Trametes cinnabarina]
MSSPLNATSASAPPDPFAFPELPALDNTFGAVLLGTFGGILLFGLTLHQTYQYFSVYTTDGPILKGLVVIVMRVHLYHYLVTNYFKPQVLLKGVWSIDVYPLVSGINMVLSQSFFARRIWLVAPQYRAVVVVAGILCLAEIASPYRIMIPTYAQYEGSQWLVSAGSTMAVTADTLLTVILIVVLRKSRTGIKRTDSMLDIMIMYSVNTGLLTGVFNLLSMLFSFTQKQTLIWIAFGIVGAKMYGTTLLAALNSRQSIAAHGAGVSYESSPFGHISGNSQPGGHSNAISQASRHRVPASKVRLPHTSSPRRRRDAHVLSSALQPRPRRAGDDQDYNDIAIELKATQLDANVGSAAFASATVPVPFGKASFADEGLDGRTVHLEQKVVPV